MLHLFQLNLIFIATIYAIVQSFALMNAIKANNNSFE